MIFEQIEKLGFEKWFQDRVDPEDMGRFDIARVVAVHKESYTINKGQGDVLAELVGRMVYSAASPMDYPVVGDWVLVAFYNEQSFSIIHQILPRKSMLKRKTPGKKIDFQMIAANIDTAFIVQSLDENFNISRLERYLVMVREGHIKPIVLLSKSDLLDGRQVTDKVAQIQMLMPELYVHPFSNEDGAGLEKVSGLLDTGKTYCLLGSSGVGKTTLLNNLLGEAKYLTHSVRGKDSKGRHATTSRQLIRLEGGAMLIDTPGMRELGNFSVAAGIDETFSEITALADNCQFLDCSHSHEKGCAVLAAVENGGLSEKRYQNYLKMKKEALFNEMSYLDKRKKDKQFGKLVKTVMKHKKNRR